MIKKNILKTTELLALICGVAITSACGCGETSQKEGGADSNSGIRLADIADGMEDGDIHSGNSELLDSDKAKEDDGKKEDETLQITVNPSALKEISVPEAIVIDDKDGDLMSLADGSEVDYPKLSANKSIPKIYISDLVGDNDYITPVRNQGYTALCWNFSALGAIESDLLIHYKDKFDADSLNLSEKHTAYYNMHKATGSYNGGIDGDYREFVFTDEDDAWIDEYDTSYISVGGVTDYCISLYTAWKGPVYDEGKDSFISIKGQSEIYSNNSEKPSDAFDNICHVQGVYEIPATEKNRDIIKLMIMEHGSVTGSICSDDELWTGKKLNLYDYKKYGGDNIADHEILIVGWNDDYEESNFITRPHEKGAFICKNSWGTKYGSEGYFYISYEDTVLSNNNVVAYDCVMPDDNRWYDGNYQYAGFLTHVKDAIVDRNNCAYMLEENSKSYGIKIQAESDEKLCAAGLFSMSTDMNYEISVFNVSGVSEHEYSQGLQGESVTNTYYNLKDLDNAIITEEFKTITGGYHTFEFTKTIDMEKGEEFLIVVKPLNKEKLVFEKEMDSTDELNYDEWKHNLGAIHTVNTCSEMCYLQDESGDLMIKQTDKDFFVKAYSKK